MTQKLHRFAFETMQFFEIEAPEGADPEELLADPETRQHFADLILSQFIDFQLERIMDAETGEEIQT